MKPTRSQALAIACAGLLGATTLAGCGATTTDAATSDSVISSSSVPATPNWGSAIANAGFSGNGWQMHVTTANGPQALSGRCNQWSSDGRCVLDQPVYLFPSTSTYEWQGPQPVPQNYLPAVALQWVNFGRGPVNVILSDGSTGVSLSNNCQIAVINQNGGTECTS